MKGHLVFLTKVGDYSALSARLVSESRGNSPGKLSRFWLNTEEGRTGIKRGILKELKQKNGLTPSTFWHMQRYMKNLAPKV